MSVSKKEIRGLILAIGMPGEKVENICLRVAQLLGFKPAKVKRWYYGYISPNLKDLENLAALSGRTINIDTLERLKPKKGEKDV